MVNKTSSVPLNIQIQDAFHAQIRTRELQPEHECRRKQSLWLGEESLLQCIEDASDVRITYSKDSVQASAIDPQDQMLLDVPAGTLVPAAEGVASTA